MSANPSFFAELQRRHVYKVGAAYAVAGWLLVQVVTQVFPIFHVSELAQRIIVLIVITGFPVALVLAWLFDLTPQGIVRTGRLPASGETPAAVRERRGADHRLNYALGALLLLALAYFAAERTLLKPAHPAAAADAAAGKSIAVLPFENLSDDKSNAYFAQGIQDEILTRLSKVGALRVISRTSTASIGSRPENLSEIARRLGVDNLLEGSVQKAGDVVRINVQLIRAATDDHLWAETYDRKLDNIFGVEGEVAQAIADALDAQLTGAEHRAMDQAPTRNAQAYDAYLRGLANELRFSSDQDYFEARRYFEQAVQLDPQFALAWAHLSMVKSYLYLNGFAHTAQGLAELRESADTAMRLQPELGEAWLARGYYFYRGLADFGAALTAFEQASKRLPNSAEVSAAIAYVQRRQGQWDAALARLREATQRDPRNVSYWIGIAETEGALRRYADAQALLDRALALSPESIGLRAQRAELYQKQGNLDAAQAIFDAMPPSIESADHVQLSATQLFYRHDYGRLTALLHRVLEKPDPNLSSQLPGLYSMLGAAELFGGNRAAAQAAFAISKARALELRSSGVDTSDLSCNLGLTEAGLGEREAALEEARHCVQLSSGDQWQSAADRTAQAMIEALVGERDTVLTALPQLLALPNGLSAGDLRFSPVWDALRGDPRFAALLAAPAQTVPAGR
ncbi:MAG: hypothetical protein JWR16_2763 [Nevskia sp.]|nr:hypothetical protein [Nevskia sp.]